MRNLSSLFALILIFHLKQSPGAEKLKLPVNAIQGIEERTSLTDSRFILKTQEASENFQPFTQSVIRPQSVYRIESVSNGKTVEVEDGVGEKGKKVQQYDAYARNGIVDGRNQEWLFIPAGISVGENVYYIINNGFLRYLDAITVNNEVFVWDGNDSETKFWVFEPAGTPNTYFIRNKVGRLYLQTPSTNRDNRAAIQLARFTGRDNQKFRFIQYGDTGPIGYEAGSGVNICPKFNTNKTICVANRTNTNGTQIILSDIVSGATNEFWRLVRTFDGYYKIRSAIPNKCIDVTGWEAGNNSTLVSWDLAEVEKQKWLIIPVAREEGYFIFFNKVSGKCMDVANASSANGAEIQTFTFRNQDNQKWRLKLIR